MSQPIMVACDLHDRTMLLLIAQGFGPVEKISTANTPTARGKLRESLQSRSAAAGGAAVIFAYEASGQGFGLCDELTAAGIQCHVLAPTRMARSTGQRRNKTDEKDALLILHLLRGHVLAGNPLPTVWVPDLATRDDRELVRTRLDAASKASAVKTQIRGLLKRNRLERPAGSGQGWTREFMLWLDGLTRDPAEGVGMRAALESLLRQLAYLAGEQCRLEKALRRLARSPRYKQQMKALTQLPGVGMLTALVFLSELGDMTRFANRKQVAAYLGIVPQAHESGEQNDRKGHITRQGPSRVRRVLCQAAWANIRSDASTEGAAYERVVERNPHHKKIAVVAVMRRLAVRMWHAARDACPAAASLRAESSLGPRPSSGLPCAAADGRSPRGQPPRQVGPSPSPSAGDLPPTPPPLGPQRSSRPEARRTAARATVKSA